jgi:uncharacterized protein YggE
MEITVVGTHEYSVPPERGTVHLDVGFEGSDLTRAVHASTELVNALNGHLEQLRAGGAGAVTWHAVGPLGTRSWRPYNNQGNVLPMRHAATAHVQAKFRDFVGLARFTTDWGARDGVRLGRVEWTVTEQRRAELESATLECAVRDARRRALVIARTVGADDVEVVEVADPGLLSGTRGQPDGPLHATAAFRAGGAAESADTAAILPEDVTGSATVHARFRAAGGPS